jgi:hypothetical protein
MKSPVKDYRAWTEPSDSIEKGCNRGETKGGQSEKWGDFHRE